MSRNIAKPQAIPEEILPSEYCGYTCHSCGRWNEKGAKGNKRILSMVLLKPLFYVIKEQLVEVFETRNLVRGAQKRITFEVRLTRDRGEKLLGQSGLRKKEARKE